MLMMYFDRVFGVSKCIFEKARDYPAIVTRPGVKRVTSGSYSLLYCDGRRNRVHAGLGNSEMRHDLGPRRRLFIEMLCAAARSHQMSLQSP